MMQPFLDCHNMPEDARIGLIGESAMRGNKTAFLIDDIPEKIARYREKLLTRFPALEITFEGQGPTAGVSTIVVQLKKSGGRA